MGIGLQCIRCAQITSLRLCQYPRKTISTSACLRVPPVTEVNNDTCVSGKVEKVMQTPPEFVLEASDMETADILKGNIAVYQDFVTEEEENSLFDEVEPHLKRLRYEKDHWDDVRTTSLHSTTLTGGYKVNDGLNFQIRWTNGPDSCLLYPLCVSRRIYTCQIVYLSHKEACPTISIHKSEIE